MRRLAGAVLVVVALVGVTPPAHAATTSSAQFAGTFFFNAPVPLGAPTVSVAFAMSTTTCSEVATHALTAKPAATTGPCGILVSGQYTGTCANGVGVGTGRYTDSLGQQLSFLVRSFVVNGSQWSMSGTITKSPVQGDFVASGSWSPTVAGCTPNPTNGTFDYTLP